MSKAQPLYDIFLQRICEEKFPVSIFLINGIKLQGEIDGFDEQAIVLRDSVAQLIFRHAISTIVPSKKLVTATSPSQDG